ncbi:GDSL lipase/acylhydrolase [Pterulicium gracile]|uniref:GDSL lipase/acylhydrolase n=1 Tax=Pterulicium gracile TaxID=1884261 RepID=A0A5C3Q7V2_9AGAR|nr:GDSL lipase/acylhydrolase [Pterula gracilis]
MQLKVLQATVGLLAAGSAYAAGLAQKRINTLVTFGDSFTDVVNTGDGGVAWPVYASSYANLSLHPFARSGATCSNKITNRPFPSLFESQLPTFFAQKANGTVTVPADRTLYTLWIGTNDVGSNALLTTYGNLGGGASIVDVTECAVGWVETMYQNGARNLLVQNMIPLNLIPTYSNGTYPDRFWNLERNSTAWSLSMFNLVNAGNALSKALLTNLAPKLKGAHVGIFDAYSLFLDMYHNPARYLNGTAPLNVTGSANACVFSLGGATNTCTKANGSDRDSFLWYDELHPSEQANRIVARQIAEVARGQQNRWTTWLS